MLSRRTRMWAAAAAVALVLWAVAALWLVPALIRSAYAGESFGFLNDAFTGRNVHGVERYLGAWRSMALRATVLILAVMAVALASVRWADQRRRLVARVLGGAGPLSGGMLFRYAIAMGVIGGLLEAGFFAVRQAVRDHPSLGYYPELLWMGPLATTLAYAAIAGVLALLARAGGVRVGAGKATFVFAFLAAYGLALGVPLHKLATLLLCLGIAATLARRATARSVSLEAAIRRAAPIAGAVLAVVVAGGVFMLPGPRENRALSRLPDPPAGAPNVILLILDTVRAANLGLYGYERATTPTIEEWAAGGVVFERAVSTAPWTLPSHATMMTGQYGFVAGAGFERALDDRHATLAEILAARGFATAAFVANLAYTTRSSGLERGFAWYQDFPIGAAMLLRSSWLTKRTGRVLGRMPAFPRWTVPKTAARINDEFLRWLDARGDRPFFAFLNYFDAHDPYPVPPGYEKRFGPTPPAGATLDDAEQHTTADLERWITAYDACIAYLDDQLGRLFRALEERGLDRNTLVILTSDHGEMFGEHNQIQHTSALYMPSLHVPLAMVYPGVLPAGVRVAPPVTLRDLPATILDVIRQPDSAIPGHTLAGLWNGELAPNGGSALLAELDAYSWSTPWKPISRGDMKSLVEDRLHYIRNGDGVEELYDPTIDVREENDLIADPRAAGAVDRFRFLLDSILRTAPSVRR